MRRDDNKTLMRRFVEDLFGRHDLDAIDRYVAPNFVDHNPAPGQAPGAQGARQSFEGILRAFPDTTFRADDYIAEGDKVVVIGSLRGTHRGEFMGLMATGRSINVPTIDVFRFEDGMQVERWGLVDQQAMLEQLGVAPQQIETETAGSAGIARFARVTRLRGRPEKLDDRIRHLRENAVPAALRLPGFRGLISLHDRRSGNGMSVTLWESEEALRESEETAKRILADAARRFGAGSEPIVERYEVLAHVAMATPEPVGSGGRH
jgi:predicted ester cyclase/heme-degrading monooxygenase HmoA